MHKIGADQPALCRRENSVGSEGFFHFGGSRLESPQQVAVPSLKILKDFGQLIVRRLGIEPKDPRNDMVCPRFVSGIEIPRFGRWLERAHDHPCRIGAQIESLTVQERGLWQNTLVFTELALQDGWFAGSQEFWARNAGNGARFARLPLMRAS